MAQALCSLDLPFQKSLVLTLDDVIDELDLAAPVDITTAVSVSVAIFDVDTALELTVVSPVTLVQVGGNNDWRASVDIIVANGFFEGQRLRLEYTFDGGAGIQGYWERLGLVQAAAAA